MARRHKTNTKPGRGGKIALLAVVVVALGLAIVAGFGAINAAILRLRTAQVVVPDLPEALEGLRILYASDIDLCGLNTPGRAGALFDQLQALRPDLLILGGDYNSPTLFERLNSPKQAEPLGQIESARSDFFHYISSFDAPLGVYAIAAPEDVEQDNLSKLMTQCGITPLFNRSVEIQSNGASLCLVGICTESPNLNAASNRFFRDDCVVAIAYSPTVLPRMFTSEARDGGAWADLALCGHTHDGQIQLLGRTALLLDDAERRFLYGWNTRNGIPVLTTSGVGCEGLNLRLGTQPEAWLIELTRQ